MKNRFLVPVITPFNSDETVNYDALKALTVKVLDEGADGIYACGSSAECYLLTDEEKQKTIETVVKAANGAFVVAHVGDIGTKKTIELARFAEKAGADAIASVPPFYFAYGSGAVEDYYKDLASSVKIPTLVYNIPSATGCNLTIEQLINIMNIKNVEYLKFTATDYFMMEQVHTATGKFVFSGKDECFLSAIAAGADGAIGTTFNFMVQKYLHIYEKFNQGNTKEALDIQKSANAITRAVVDTNCLPATKYLLSLKGIDAGVCRRPFVPLNDENKKYLKEIYEKYIEI